MLRLSNVEIEEWFCLICFCIGCARSLVEHEWVYSILLFCAMVWVVKSSCYRQSLEQTMSLLEDE